MERSHIDALSLQTNADWLADDDAYAYREQGEKNKASKFLGLNSFQE